MAAVTPAQVRAFARENGLAVGTRGKFSAEVIEAYNAGKRKEHRYTGQRFVATRPVAVATTDKRGRNRTAQVAVDPRAARAWAVANGHAVKEGKGAGRLPKTVVAAYAASLVG